MVARLTSDEAPKPPSDAFIDALEKLESHIVSGAAFLTKTGPVSSAATALVLSWHASQMFAQIDSPEATHGPNTLWHAGQMFAQPRARDRGHRPFAQGRITLRLRVTSETYRFYRSLERTYHRHRPTSAPFFRFLCESLIDTWKDALHTNVAAYGDVYARDRFRCRCPVCTRRDRTPHHLKRRSQGGSDARENVAAVCTWCHLDGIHGGRIEAYPPADDITWSIGREPHTIVKGRRRIRLDGFETMRRAA